MRIARVMGWAAASVFLVAGGCLAESTQHFRLNATLDGAAFDATGVVAGVENSVLSIAGTAQGLYLNLRVAMPGAPGTVSFGADTLAISRGDVISGTTTWSTIYGGSGSVTFTQTVGEQISGTFSFTAIKTPTQTGAATRVVTNGTFSARF